MYKLVIWNTGKGIYNENYNYMNKSKLFPSNKSTVKDLINNQIKLINELDADFYMLQEVTKKHYQNYYINQYDKFLSNIKDYSFNYVSTSKNLFVNEGKLNIIRTNYEVVPSYIDLKKINVKYNNSPSLINKIKIKDKTLVLINVHLIPFKENFVIRSKQLNTLLKYAYKEYLNGSYVILGGDFNMDEKYIDLDLDFTKTIGKNTKRGLRLNSKYLSIDGFITSPNIEIKSFSVLNNYTYSDHTPVILEFKLK